MKAFSKRGLRPLGELVGVLAIGAVLMLAAGWRPGGANAAPPAVTVYKTASCGCCVGWVEHLQAAGFQTQVHDVTDLAAVKEQLGVPRALGSCHTATVGEYVIEGHVPAADIRDRSRSGRRRPGWRCRACRWVHRAWNTVTGSIPIRSCCGATARSGGCSPSTAGWRPEDSAGLTCEPVTAAGLSKAAAPARSRNRPGS